MFLGHFGVALAAKKTAPEISLGTLIIAAQLVDLIWPVMLLFGVETVRITPNDNPFLNLEFVSYPFTHSALFVVLWGVALGVAYVLIMKRKWRAAVILVALVFSHWILDLASHQPDLPLVPGNETQVGLGLWNSQLWTIIVESIIFLAGIAIYLRQRQSLGYSAIWKPWILFGLLIGIYVASIFGEAPPSVEAIAWAGLLTWLFPLLGYWVDRKKSPTH